MTGEFGSCEVCGDLTRISYLRRNEKILCWYCRRVKKTMKAILNRERNKSIILGRTGDNNLTKE
ncbi:hypothetical protein ACFL2J_00170 [Candidatus Omnitrophota bacterium]